MIPGKTATTTIAAAGLITLALQFTAGRVPGVRAGPRLEFRVVASKQALLRQLDEAGGTGPVPDAGAH
jgi:hypothetical protein